MDARAWDDRYAASELVWSREPNQFVAAELADLPPGRAVDLAAGEGRNAIWLASRGWSATAVDFSQVALDKGARLAGDLDVTWVCADATRWDEPAAYDRHFLPHRCVYDQKLTCLSPVRAAIPAPFFSCLC